MQLKEPTVLNWLITSNYASAAGKGSMRRFFSFWWLCTRNAFGGNTAFANEWQWILGNPIASSCSGITLAALGAVAPTVAKQLGTTEVTTGMPALDSLIGAAAAFILTWLVAYMVRFLNAPVVLFHEQKSRADKLDGTPPPSQKRKSTSIDKQMATLTERYLSEKPRSIHREQIDYLVDGVKAIGDVACTRFG